MKHNYAFLHRPGLLCLALIWLALQADFAFAQTRANGTPVRPGGSTSSTKKVAHVTTTPLLAGAEITISPSGVSDTLNSGRQSTKQIVVQNTGTDTLVFRAGAVPHFGPPRGPIRVLAVFNDESMASQIPLLFANAPDIQLSVFRTFPYQGNFTVDYLAAFDVVLIGNSNPLGFAGQDTRVLVGNVLADYVDAGGKVIMTASTYYDDNPTGLGGRLIEEQYGPVLPPPLNGVPGPATLGTVVEPNHPFMQGVSNLSYSGGGAILTLAPGARDIAHFSTGTILVATTPHVAVVNMAFAWDNHNQIRFWDGDIDILMTNIVRYFNASQAIRVSPIRGAIAPGGQQTLDIDFDATGLDSAVYVSDLEIYSNATDTLVTSPLTLVVTGDDILFEPDTLKEALHKDQTSVRTFTITNNSPEDHTFTISGVPVYTTVSPLSGSIASGESATITVNFSSVGLEFDTYPDAMSFNVDGIEWQAPVSLYVFDDPAIEVSVTELHDTLAYREESVQTFEIRNTGGSTLTYSLSLVENSANPQQARFVASVPLLEENFDGPVFPPQNWGNPADDYRNWKWNTEYVYNNTGYYGNYAGTGKSAMIGQIFPGGVQGTNASIVTPEISTAGYRHFSVEYNASFVPTAYDSMNLEIQVDNGAWESVLIWGYFDRASVHGTPFRLPGEHVSVSLDDFVDSTATSFRLRWRYADLYSFEEFWYGQIDDVVVSGERRQWLNVVPETGSIEPGESVTLSANFDAEEVFPGLYTGELQISSNDPQVSLVSIPVSLYVTPFGDLVVAEDSISQVVPAGETVVGSLTLTNTGGTPVQYDFSSTPSGTPIIPGTIQYTTNFDNFTPGPVVSQEGWEPALGGPTVVNDASGPGKRLLMQAGVGEIKVFRGPVPPQGSEDITSVRMDLGVSGVALKFMLTLAPNAGENMAVLTYQATQPNVLVIHSYDATAAAYTDHTVAVSGIDKLFNLRVDINHIEDSFVLYIDGQPVFNGVALADWRQMFFYVANPGSFYVESYTVSNGAGPEYYKTINPVSGTLAPGASTNVSVTFEPINSSTGSYRDTLTVTDNGGLGGVARIPVHFVVEAGEDQNTAPVLQRKDSAEAVEYGVETLVFTATDADNEAVTIGIKNIPAFVALSSSSNGKSTYAIKPQVGDVGVYDLNVVARDARGKKDSIVCRLFVSAYGVSWYHLKERRTGEVLATFADSVVLDVADLDYNELMFQVDTKPVKVGSVKFWWDNRIVNIDNSAPYVMNPFVLPLSRGGRHILKTQAFTKVNGRGSKGTAQEAVVTIINSAAVTGFDVVKPDGSVLSALANDGIIDISQNNYRFINIRANVSGNTVKSVVFKLNGKLYRVDNAADFNLSGFRSGHDMPWFAKPGIYTLEATPYSSRLGLGVAGTPVAITFRVANGAGSSARTASEEAVIPEETVATRLSVYPVPVTDVLHINLPPDEKGYVHMVIHDVQGRAIYSREGDVSTFRDHTISTEKAGMTKGFYYIQVLYSSGKREVRKFLKE